MAGTTTAPAAPVADVVDPQALAFCNDKIRPFADALRTLFYTAQSLLSLVAANPETMALLPDNASAVKDGLPHNVTGHDINNIVVWANQVNTLGAGNSDLLNSIERVSLSGRSLF